MSKKKRKSKRKIKASPGVANKANQGIKQAPEISETQTPTRTAEEYLPLERELLVNARTQWILGDWAGLADLQRDRIEHHPDRAQLALYTAAGNAQLGQGAEAREFAALAREWGCDRQLMAQILISGTYDTLARIAAQLGQPERFDRHLTIAMATGMPDADVSLLIQARSTVQQRQSGVYPNHITGYQRRAKKLFIDCGGHDGCSTIKFKLFDPTYDIITFEGNPELWCYYEALPTLLIKKLVCDHNGEVEFIIDPVDADGSSIIKEKTIDYHNTVTNDDCPVIVAQCRDLSEFVKEQAKQYEEIIVKLDVEGAEYAILEKMLQDGTVKYIAKLYAEFHWKKIRLPKETHDALIEKLTPHFGIESWDASEFSVHKKPKSQLKIRKQILAFINKTA